MADIGLSFSQTSQPGQQQQGAGANAAVSPLVQDAIKILSFRMPSVVGASAPAATSILNGMGSRGLGSPFGSLLQQWLGNALSGGGGSGQPTAPGQPPNQPTSWSQAPNPSFTFSPPGGGMSGPTGPTAPVAGGNPLTVPGIGGRPS